MCEKKVIQKSVHNLILTFDRDADHSLAESGYGKLCILPRNYPKAELLGEGRGQLRYDDNNINNNLTCTSKPTVSQ